MDRKTYLKILGGGVATGIGAMTTLNRSFAKESKGVINYDNKIIVNTNELLTVDNLITSLSDLDANTDENKIPNASVVNKIRKMTNSVQYISDPDDDDYDWVVAISPSKERKRIKKAGFDETFLLINGVVVKGFETDISYDGNAKPEISGDFLKIGTAGGNVVYGWKVDLTNYATLTFNGYRVNGTYGGYTGGGKAGLFTTMKATAPGFVEGYSATLGTTNTPYTYDISKLEGEYYIGAATCSGVIDSHTHTTTSLLGSISLK